MDEKIKNFMNNFNNTEDTTHEFTQEDIDNNKIMALFSYLSILFLVPLFGAKDSNYARFHLNQGIILFIVNISASFLLGILNFILVCVPIIGVLIAKIIELAVSVFVLVLMIIGIVNAVTGKAKKLPFIGNLFTIIK